MVKKAPESKIPQLKGVAIPEIVETVKSVDHYRVGNEPFLIKSRATKVGKVLGIPVVPSCNAIKAFSVGDDNFLTFPEAEKKLKSVVKKHRDLVREGARLFSIDKASFAEKNVALKWLLETYELNEINKFFERSPDGFRFSTYGVFSPVGDYFFDFYSDLLRHSYISGNKERDVLHWSWLQNRSYDSFGVPEEFKKSPLRETWIKRKNLFSEKMELVKRLIDLRFLELLFLEGQKAIHRNAVDDAPVNGVSSFVKLVESLDLELIAREVKDLYAVMNQAELGADLRIEFKNGEVVYAVNGEPELGAAFKRF